MLREFIISLSLANICFLGVWPKLFYTNANERYLAESLPTAYSFLALIINELVLTLLIWLVIRLLRRLQIAFLTKSAKVIFSLIVLNFIYVVEAVYINTKLGGEIGKHLLNLLLFILVIIVLVRRKAFQTAVKVVLILAPFAVLIFAQSAWGIVKDLRKVGYVNTTKSPRALIVNSNPSRRVLWLIFDEMDQRITFAERPNTIKLPEFDRFRREALYAVNAYSPGKETEVSIPALLTGRKVLKVLEDGSNELLLNFKGTSEMVPWSSQPSIFSQAADLNINTALVGWFHPYSRIIGDQLMFCKWCSWTYSIVSPDKTLTANIGAQLYSFYPFLSKEKHIKSYSEILANVKKLEVDPKYGLVFVHFPIPHPPLIYNQTKGRLTLFPDKKRGYLGNLVLADKTFGELRKDLESRKLWDDTTILVTADHKWRHSQEFDGKTDARVPFILKLAGQKEAVTFNPSFNTVLTKDLLLEIFKGNVTTSESLVHWLDQHQTTGNDLYPIGKK